MLLLLPQCLNKSGRIILKLEAHGKVAKAALMIIVVMIAKSTTNVFITAIKLYTKLQLLG